MEKLSRKKAEIEKQLLELKSAAAENDLVLERIASEIRQKAAVYNEQIGRFKENKLVYKEKMEKLSELSSLVKEYRQEQKHALYQEYEAELHRLMTKINTIGFEFKLEIFKKLDQLQNILCDKFPNLNRQKESYLKDLKFDLRKRLFDSVKNTMADKSTFNDMIYYINFLVRFEIYFHENIFNDLLLSIISDEFEYHFLSNRESNRLDKPEWVFTFLNTKYEEMESIFRIHEDCSKRASGIRSEYSQLLALTERLVTLKLEEILESGSPQKRKLLFHFTNEFTRFNSALSKNYSFHFSSDRLSYALNQVQREYLRQRVQDIQSAAYTEWFTGYREVCKDAMAYVVSYHYIDRDFSLDESVRPICVHTKAFAENLRFINRKEIQIVCFLFSEVEELKNCIRSEEDNMRLEAAHDVPDDLSLKSHLLLTDLNAELFRIIRDIAINDIISILDRVIIFNYSSVETRRTALVGTHHVLADYKGSSCYDIVEAAMVDKASSIFADEILARIRFSPEEYLELRQFYKDFKRAFVSGNWPADAGFRAADAIFNGERLAGPFYKSLRKLYNLD